MTHRTIDMRMSARRRWLRPALIAALGLFGAGGSAVLVQVGAADGLDAVAAPSRADSAPASDSARPLHAERGFGLLAHEAGGGWSPVMRGVDPPSRMVLLVHGLDEPGSIWEDLAPALRAALQEAEDDGEQRHGAGAKIVRFEYPNDQPIAESADLFAEALSLLRAGGVERVDLVCHSMGGLVARDALTREEHYGGAVEATETLPDIDRFIMVGTPHHGAPLARLRLLSEIREQVMRFFDDGGRTEENLLRFMDDGAGEAGEDLLPGSAFLEDLNSRPLPEGVRMTIIAGTVSPVSSEEIREWIDSRVGRAVLGAKRAERFAAALAEAGETLGDGVVPLESALLEGVDDVVLLGENHRSMLKRARVEKALRGAVAEDGESPPAPAIEVILDRLTCDQSGGEEAAADGPD